MASNIALDGLRLTCNEDNTADIMLPSLSKTVEDDGGNKAMPTNYPNGLLPFAPKYKNENTKLLLRQCSKSSIVIACLTHVLSSSNSDSTSDSGDSLFQNKLLSLSTPCNTSILSTSIVIERDESIDRNVIQLKPSLNEIENILLNDVVSDLTKIK